MMSILSLPYEKIIYCRTETAEYWMMVLRLFGAYQITNIYRRSNGEDGCMFIGRFKVPFSMPVNETATILSECNRTIITIVPKETRLVDLCDIPPRKNPCIR